MNNRRQELFDLAAELGIKVINALALSDQNRVAIHLLNPDLNAFEHALQSADRDGFNVIVIHSNKTWPHKNRE